MALIQDNVTPLSVALTPATSEGNAASAEMHVSTIHTMEDLRGLLPEWREFLTHGVQGARFYGDPVNVESNLENGKSLAPFIVVVRRQGRIVCLAPFYINRMRFKIKLSVLTVASLPIRMLKLFGDRILCGNDCPPRECFDAVMEELRRQRKSFDLLFLDALDCADPLWQYCAELRSRGGAFRVSLASAAVEKVHVVRIDSTHDAYLASLTPSTRQELRRKTRRLLNDHGGQLVKVTRPEQVAEFLDQLDTVYRTSWQAKTFGYQPRNTEQQRRCFERIAQQGWLRSYLLRQKDQPIAFELGYQYGGIYYGEECGFDPDKASLGPGSVLLHLVVEDLFKEDRPKLLDFGLGDAVYKRSFANDAHEAASLYVAPRNIWRYVLALQRGLNRVDVGVRALLVKSRLDGFVRRFLKHKKR